MKAWWRRGCFIRDDALAQLLPIACVYICIYVLIYVSALLTIVVRLFFFFLLLPQKGILLLLYLPRKKCMRTLVRNFCLECLRQKYKHTSQSRRQCASFDLVVFFLYSLETYLVIILLISFQKNICTITTCIL